MMKLILGSLLVLSILVSSQAFAEEEYIKFISVWLKQPILEVDTTNFSKDNKAIDFSVKFKTPNLGGISEGMFCRQKIETSEANKISELEGERQIYFKLRVLNNGELETILAKELSAFSNGSVDFEYREPAYDSKSLKILPQELDGIACMSGFFKDIYGEYLTIQGSLVYDGFSVNDEYQLDTWAGESIVDKVTFIIPEQEYITEPTKKIIESEIIELEIEEEVKKVETIESMIGEIEIHEELEIIKSEIIEEKIKQKEISKQTVIIKNTPEPVFIPELTAEPEPIINPEPKEEKGFFDWLMSLFGFN